MNCALVGLSCKRFMIFNLGAHSWAVNVGVARRCRSTNHNVSCRAVPRIGEHARIVSATMMYLCRSEWMFHVASRNPFMGESRLLWNWRAGQLLPQNKTSCPRTPYSTEEEDFLCGMRNVIRSTA